MADATLIVMWYKSMRKWVACDDNYLGLYGEGHTPEEAVSDLRDALQATLELDEPIWVWRGSFYDSHI